MELINYAHRGASSYAPENTFAAFYMGWGMGARKFVTPERKSLVRCLARLDT